MWCNGGWQAYLLFGQIHLGGGWWGAAEVSTMPRRKEGKGGSHSQTVPGSHLGQIGEKHALQFVDVELLTIPMQAKAKQTWLIL